MINVLIAEDEMLVRIGIKNSIQWEKLGMFVIADVANGKEAFDVYENKKPDLILTDIKMPVMDGIELISKIREHDKRTKIIILTCHEEFNLVHKALKLGVTDYILKLKMSINEMESVLTKAGEELSNEDPRFNQNQKMDKSLIKQNVIKDYIFYKLYNDDQFESIMKKAELRLIPERMILCIMEIDKVEALQTGFTDKQVQSLHLNILNITDGLLNEYKRGEIFHDKNNRFILIFSFADIISENKIIGLMDNMLNHIHNVLKKYVNVNTFFCISNMCNEYSSLFNMYMDTAAALEQKYFDNDRISVKSDCKPVERIRPVIGRKFKKLLEDLSDIPEEYKRKISSDIDQILSRDSVLKDEIQRTFIQWVSTYMIECRIINEKLSGLILEFSDRIHLSDTLDESIEVFKEYIQSIKRNALSEKLLSKEVVESIRLIRKSYGSSLSVQEVSDHVEVSANYFSSIFKKEIGMSFVEYVNQVRIEKAKEMLVNSNLKSYQISKSVGFTDESYFSRIFKKVTGVRPHEFRKQRFVDEGEDCHAEKDF